MIDRFKAVLFDFDFTLGDSSSGIYDCVNFALAELGYCAAEPAEIRKTIGYPLRHIFATLTQSDSKYEERLFIEYFTKKADEVITASTTIYPGVPATIDGLRSKGAALGIVSTKYRYRIEEILAKHNMQQQFSVIVGGEDVSYHKPHPEGVLKALEKLDARVEEVLYVGDSIVDAELTKNAGISFAAVLTGITSRETFEPFAPVAIYNSVGDLEY